MSIDFRAVAINELTLSPLMVNREKISTEELIGETVTIVAFDFANITDKGEDKTYPIMIFAEYPDRYYNGGTLLLKLCAAWTAAAGGDVETASDALKKQGGVKIRFRSTKTKSGNNLTSVDVV